MAAREEPGGASAALEVARAGVVAILLHRLRSGVSVAAVAAMLLPYIVGIGISRGVLDQAEDSVRLGADLYVTGERLGRPAPLPLSAVDALRQVPGVADVVPRTVAEVRLGRDRVSAVLVGLPAERFPAHVRIVEGRLPRDGPEHELVIGSELARRLGLSAGSPLPPFYRNPEGERVSRVVGLFRADLPIWQAHVVLTTLDTASAVFAEPQSVGQVLVSARPGYGDAVRGAILRMESLAPPGPTGLLRPRVVARDDLAAVFERRLTRREGVFTVHFLLAFAIGVPLVLVSTGFGLSERRREVGVLKATGWRTDEVLLRGFVESVTLGVAGASAAILLAFVWLRGLDGTGVAPIFIAGADAQPGFDVPFRLAPVPVLLAVVIALAVTTTGSLWSTWRAASAPPAEAMR